MCNAVFYNVKSGLIRNQEALGQKLFYLKSLFYVEWTENTQDNIAVFTGEKKPHKKQNHWYLIYYVSTKDRYWILSNLSYSLQKYHDFCLRFIGMEGYIIIIPNIKTCSLYIYYRVYFYNVYYTWHNIFSEICLYILYVIGSFISNDLNIS